MIPCANPQCDFRVKPWHCYRAHGEKFCQPHCADVYADVAITARSISQRTEDQ